MSKTIHCDICKAPGESRPLRDIIIPSEDGKENIGSVTIGFQVLGVVSTPELCNSCCHKLVTLAAVFFAPPVETPPQT